MSDPFSLETINGVTVFIFSHITDIIEVREQLYGLAERRGSQRLLLDFTNVRFVSSHSFGILANVQKKVIAAGGLLRLCCLDADLLQDFRITHLDRVFAIFESRQEALDNF